MRMKAAYFKVLILSVLNVFTVCSVSADIKGRLYSVIPNLLSKSMHDSGCSPVTYKGDEYVAGPAYVYLDTASSYIYMCEKKNEQIGLEYKTFINIPSRKSNSSFTSCVSSFSVLPGKDFKPAGIFLKYKSNQHIVNEGQRYSLDGKRVVTSFNFSKSIATLDISDGVGMLSYACSDGEWSYSVLGP